MLGRRQMFDLYYSSQPLRLISDGHTQLQSDQAEGKNPAAVALGRLGGLKGGKARAEKLTPEQRSEIAKKAANARWQKS